jgi:hypothetical protein
MHQKQPPAKVALAVAALAAGFAFWAWTAGAHNKSDALNAISTLRIVSIKPAPRIDCVELTAFIPGGFQLSRRDRRFLACRMISACLKPALHVVTKL